MTILEKAWTERLADYNDAIGSERAYYEGEFAAINDADDLERERLNATYGSLDLARSNPIGRAAFDASYALVTEAETRGGEYGDRTRAALYALMLTPAPDWNAVQTKIAAALEHDYDDLTDRPEPSLESISRDIRTITNL